MHFVLPDTAIDYEKVHKPNFFGLETWKKYINPLEWFVNSRITSTMKFINNYLESTKVIILTISY